jgi:hypothetical protein
VRFELLQQASVQQRLGAAETTCGAPVPMFAGEATNLSPVTADQRWPTCFGFFTVPK